MSFQGGNPNAPATGLFPTSGIGASGQRVQAYGETVYQNVWPGISVTTDGTAASALEQTYVVAAGADPAAIGLAFSGVTGLSIDQSGNLNLTLADGAALQQSAPTLYQLGPQGQRVPVDGGFLLQLNDVADFRIGTYNNTEPLYIDPTYLYTVTGPTNTVGQTVSFDASDSAVSGLTYTATGLPPGLSISSSGLVTGTILTGASAVGYWNPEVRGTIGGDIYVAHFT